MKIHLDWPPTSSEKLYTIWLIDKLEYAVENEAFRFWNINRSHNDIDRLCVTKKKVEDSEALIIERKEQYEDPKTIF